MSKCQRCYVENFRPRSKYKGVMTIDRIFLVEYIGIGKFELALALCDGTAVMHVQRHS